MQDKENEIIQLRKQIYHLEKSNRDLKDELEDKKIFIGKLESEHSKMKNESLLVTKTKLSQQTELIRYNVEKAMEEDKLKIEYLEKRNTELQRTCEVLELNNRNLEDKMTKYQKENQILQMQVSEFGKTHKVEDLLIDLQARDKIAMIKDRDYQKLVNQWNELVDKMEKVMSENSILREWANVPQNLGLPMDQIKLGEKKNIQYYKAALSRAEDEIRELEEERARLKNKLLIFDSYRDAGETPFSMLTLDQQQDVLEYALALHENRQHVVPHQYELFRENEKLKMKVEILEKQLDNMKVEAAAINYNKSSFYDNKFKDGNPNGDTYNNSYQTNNGLNKDVVDMISSNVKKEISDMKNFVRTTLDNYDNNSKKFGNMYQSSSYDMNLNNNDDKNFGNLGLSRLQLPPFPIQNIEDPNNDYRLGFSNRMYNKYKVDINQIHNLFGVVPIDPNPEQLKIQSASLFTQLIETIEVNNRMKLQDKKINANLDGCSKQVEGLVLRQNALFEKFIIIKKLFTSKEDEYKNEIEDLKIKLEGESKRRQALEECVKIIESKNLSAIERRIIDKIKESSVLEMRILYLQRKYNSLYEEHSKLKAFSDELEANLIEKDNRIDHTICNLKEWKNMMIFYLKLMIKKLKNSVDKGEFNKIVLENSFLRDKQKELITREISSSNQTNNVDYLKIKLRETEHSLLEEQELRVETQIDSFFIKNRLRIVDNEYAFGETVFNKFLVSLIQLSTTVNDLENLLDFQNTGKITQKALYAILEDILIVNNTNKNKLSLINVVFSKQEIMILSTLLNFEDENKEIEIDLITKYIKKNSFSFTMNENETLFEGLIDNLKAQGNTNLFTLFKALDSFESGIIDKEAFAFVINSSFNSVDKLNIQSSSHNENNIKSNIDYSSNIANFVCGEYKELVFYDHNTRVNYVKFIELFELKKKELAIRKRNDKFSKQMQKLFLKDNIMNNIIEKMQASGLSSETILIKLKQGSSSLEFMENNNKKELAENNKLTKNDFIGMITDLNAGVINMKEVDFIFDYFSQKEEVEDSYQNDKDSLRNSLNNSTLNNLNKLNKGYSNFVKTSGYVNTNSNKMINYREVIDFKDFADALKIAESKFNILKNIGTNITEVNYNVNNLNKLFNMNSMISNNSNMNNNNSNLNNNKSNTSIANNFNNKTYTNSKNNFLIEKANEEKFLEFKLKQLKKQYFEVQKENKDLSSQLEDLFKKNLDLNKKFSEAKDELVKLKVEYEHGITKEEYQHLEQKNESLERDLSIHRIGMNTFKDLYKSTSKQLESIHLLNEKHKDELETYRLAIKDLQGESDAKALMGKLYYSLLVSRWRESKTIAKYDDLVNELIKIKETNFKFETDNQQYLKTIFELEEKLHDKIVENVKLSDELRAHSNPIISFENYEKLNQSIHSLNKDKNDLMICYLDLMKTHNGLITEYEEMKNIVDYYDVLSKNLTKLHDKDQYSLRIIALSDEIAKFKLEANSGKRENKNLKETETYLKKIIDNFEKDINRLEKENNELSTKLRKLEEYWISKDKERQSSFFEQIKIFRTNRDLGKNNNENDSDYLKNKISELEAKLSSREEALSKKNIELKSAIENLNVIQNSDPHLILNEEQRGNLQDEETRQLAQTSHQIIKTLQDMILLKNNQILDLEKALEQTKDDSLKTKASYIREITTLQEKIDGLGNNAFDRLRKFIDTSNPSILVKISPNTLSKMTLKEIQDLLDEKDQVIKNMAFKLKTEQEEKETTQMRLGEVNKLKMDRETDLFLNSKNKGELINEIQNLKFELGVKATEIGVLQNKITEIADNFNKRLEERKLMFEEEYLKRLDKSAFIPNRNINNEENKEINSKIQAQRNQIKKANEAKEKLSKENIELKKLVETLNQKISRTKDHNKRFEDIQLNDNKRISALSKKNEELKSKLEKSEKDCEGLRTAINNMQANLEIYQKGSKKTETVNRKTENVAKKTPQSVTNNPFLNDNKRNLEKEKEKEKQKSSEDDDIDEYLNEEFLKDSKDEDFVKKESNENKDEKVQQKSVIINNLESNNDINKNSTIINKLFNEKIDDKEKANSLLKKLVDFCLKKQKNICRSFKHYSPSLNKIKKEDFCKAIHELKLGFIEDDILSLFSLCENDGLYIDIDSFVKLMIKCNSNYENIARELSKFKILLIFIYYRFR